MQHTAMKLVTRLGRNSRRFAALCTAVSLLSLGPVVAGGTGPAFAGEAPELAGIWELVGGHGARRCRISLNADRASTGEFVAGILPACRHGLPVLSKAENWSMSDETHLALTTSDGETVLDFTRAGDGFTAQGPGGPYQLTRLRSVTRATPGIDPAAETVAPGKPAVIQLATQPKKPAAVTFRPSELAGRYAVLRDKHDTGCMLTLDNETKVRGGNRAALAPACRDQGIVVFDPSAWQIISGRLVLTAKAGHNTHLDYQQDGTWLKDPAEGRSLTLKKL